MSKQPTTVIARNEAISQLCQSWSGKPTTPTVIARNEAISKLCQSRTGKPTTPTVIARNEAISQLCQSRTGLYFSKRLPQALALLFCLTLSLNSIAQKKDTIGAKTMYDLLQQIKKQPGTSDPLVMVDDSVFKGDLHKIDEQNVREVQVIRGDGAKVIYGPNAKNGVFIIKTKTGVLNTFIQPENLPPPPKTMKVKYVVDGEVVDTIQVDPSDIFEKRILHKKDIENAFPYGDHAVDSLVLIITKNDAKKSYQNKFSALSKAYSDHLAHAGDKDVNYILNGILIQGSELEKTRRLYDILSDVDRVTFADIPACNGPPCQPYIAIITTKK